jgi:hypothetical protein
MFFSSRETIGFALLAAEGEIGQVSDLYFDSDDWAVRYLAAEAGAWLAGRRLLLSSASLGLPDPGARQISVALDPEQLRNSPGPAEAGAALHSMQTVFGSALQSRDGRSGRLEDFLVDETWAIRYMVAGAGGWPARKQVLLAAAWITAIHPESSLLEVDLSQETIANSPEYDPRMTIDRGYEERLFDHYGRPGYWR